MATVSASRGNGGAPAGRDGRRPSVAIVGAGFAGIGAAIMLRRAGFEDVTLFDRGAQIGGTWHHNTYPGLACDVPSHLYSFSFARNPDWTRRFSPQEEIQAYLERTAREHGVADRVRLATDVSGASFDEASGRWQLDTSAGPFEADVLMTACGVLRTPSTPAIAGAERFEGAAFHSGHWDHSVDLRGQRVAVIGTGASAIQFVPEIQPQVKRLHVFQRSPGWIIPKTDKEYSDRERAIFRRFPLAQRASRLGMWLYFESIIPALTGHPRAGALPKAIGRTQLRMQVRDPELRRKLTPTGEFGCKRALISNDWYPALTQPNVELVTDRIREITATGVVTEDGDERAVDTIIYGTGYRTHDFVAPMEIRGRGGRTLSEAWSGGPEAYYGMAVAGFPNMFLLYGPNTNLGAGSIIYMLESQARHAIRALGVLDRTGADTIEVTPEAQAELNAELRERLADCVWSSGCGNWYIDEHGRDSTNWPGQTIEYRRRVAKVDPRAYRLGRAAVSEPEPAVAVAG